MAKINAGVTKLLFGEEIGKTYSKLSKGKLFYVALSYYQLTHPNNPTDMKNFIRFCFDDADKWKQENLK